MVSLPLASCPCLPPSLCSRGAQGTAQSRSDWLVECSLFQAPVAEVPENWLDAAWEDPWLLSCDCRESALFGDGSFSLAHGASYCCQSRGFGSQDAYWLSASWASTPISGRLPRRFGWETCTVHTAELFAALCSLQFRRPGCWHLLVFDRSALFSCIRTAAQSPPPHILASPCLTLLTQLRHLLTELDRCWLPTAPKPAWRLHQEHLPSMWNVSYPRHGKLRSFASISYTGSGVVGVDIRSHQSESSLPFPVLVSGNEAQDAGCSAALALPVPPDVLIPSGGTFAWFSADARMVTSPIRNHVRSTLRMQSTEAWSKRAVQGLIPRLSQHLFLPALDPSLYIQCTFPDQWLRWSLPSDAGVVDLSPVIVRLHRAIGGAWTERLHSQSDLLTRDAIETELSAAATAREVQKAAALWRNTAGDAPPPPPLASQQRWPILSQWRWFVPIPSREELLRHDVDGSSTPSAQKELGSDLAYRCILPRGLGLLGLALCNSTESELSSLEAADPEGYATLLQKTALQSELDCLARRYKPFLPAVFLCQRLALGLRFIRSAYLQRIQVWAKLAQASLPPPPLPLSQP